MGSTLDWQGHVSSCDRELAQSNAQPESRNLHSSFLPSTDAVFKIEPPMYVDNKVQGIKQFLAAIPLKVTSHIRSHLISQSCPHKYVSVCKSHHMPFTE